MRYLILLAVLSGCATHVPVVIDTTETVNCLPPRTDCQPVSKGLILKRFELERALINTEADLRICRNRKQ